MKIFVPDNLTRFLIFGIGCFLIVDLLVYSLKEWQRISRLNAKGRETEGEFTNIQSVIVKRKMKSTADLRYTAENGKKIMYKWQKGFFDEEVLLFRNKEKNKLNVKVKYDPEKPENMFVVDCYNRKKHLLVIILSIISVFALGYCLLTA